MKRPFWFLFSVAAVLLLSIAVVKTAPGHDFKVYWVAGQSLLSGRIDLYASDFGLDPILDYRYPPLFILLFAPLSLLPMLTAEFIWAGLTLAALFFAFFFYKSTFEKTLSQAKSSKLIFFLVTLLCLKYVLIGVRTLNVHMIAVSLFIVAVCLVIRKLPAGGAALTALVISVKIFPVLSLPYFVIKREWKFVAFTGIILFLLFLAPSLYFGFRTNLDLHADWVKHVVFPPEFYELNGPPDMAVDGVLTRYFSHIDYQSRIADREYPNVNVADLPRSIVQPVVLATAGLIALITHIAIWKSRRKKPRAEADGESAGFLSAVSFHEIGLIICMILLIGPRTNIIYVAALFVPLTAVLYSLVVERKRALIIPIGITAVVSCVLPLIPGANMSRLFLSLGMEFFSVFALWLGLLWLVLENPKTDESFQNSTI